LISISIAHNYLFNYLKRLKIKNLKRFAVAFGMVAFLGAGSLVAPEKAEAQSRKIALIGDEGGSGENDGRNLYDTTTNTYTCTASTYHRVYV
jgi:hypothetical protein